MTKITKKNFKEALKNSAGNQTRIAEKLEVTRGAVCLFLKKHPDMREIQEEERNKLYDAAEDNVAMDIMVHHDTDQSKWILLNTKRGRERGYGQKIETEHTGNIPVTIQLIEKSPEEIKHETNSNKPKTAGNDESPRGQ